MPGGRPTLYTDETLAKTEEYLANFHKQDDLIPSVAGLACFLGVGKSTVKDWKRDKPEFSAMLERMMMVQEKFLLRGGLSGDMNATIAKLVLAKHDYSDKQELKADHTSKGESIQLPMHSFVKSDG